MANKLKSIGTKILAAIAAVLVCTACLGSLMSSANEITIYSNGSKSFGYDMRVEILGSNQMKLHVDFVNTLSVTSYSFVLFYDENCTVTDVAAVGSYYADDSVKGISVAFAGGAITGNFSLEVTFTTADAAANQHTFTGKVVELSDNNTAISDFDNTEHKSYTMSTQYIVGDVDNNGSLTALDASYVLQFVSAYGTIKLADQGTYYTKCLTICPTLLTLYAADANIDKVIDAQDATKITECAAKYNLGTLTEEDIVGTKYCITITE